MNVKFEEQGLKFEAETDFETYFLESFLEADSLVMYVDGEDGGVILEKVIEEEKPESFVQDQHKCANCTGNCQEEKNAYLNEQLRKIAEAENDCTPSDMP